VSGRTAKTHMLSMLVTDIYRAVHWQTYWCPEHREQLQLADLPHLCLNCGRDERQTPAEFHQFQPESRAATALPIKLCSECTLKPYVNRQLTKTKDYQPQPVKLTAGSVRGNYLTARHKAELQAVEALRAAITTASPN